jgi:hypothetical protein
VVVAGEVVVTGWLVEEVAVGAVVVGAALVVVVDGWEEVGVDVVGEAVVEVVVSNARVVATLEGRSVTWSRTSATACEASRVAIVVAATQATTRPTRRLFMDPVWITSGCIRLKRGLSLR